MLPSTDMTEQLAFITFRLSVDALTLTKGLLDMYCHHLIYFLYIYLKLVHQVISILIKTNSQIETAVRLYVIALYFHAMTPFPYTFSAVDTITVFCVSQLGCAST